MKSLAQDPYGFMQKLPLNWIRWFHGQKNTHTNPLIRIHIRNVQTLNKKLLPDKQSIPKGIRFLTSPKSIDRRTIKLMAVGNNEAFSVPFWCI